MNTAVAISPTERIIELERELQKTSQENRMLREEITWFENLLRLPTSTMSPSEQKTVYALHKAAQGRDPDFFKVDTRELSESVGQSQGTFLRNTKTIAENLGIVEKRTEDVWYSNGVNEDGSDKRSKYTYLYVKAQELLEYPRLYVPQVERNHGGKREGAGRKPKCRTCQSEHLAITDITKYRCLDCHDVWYEQGEEILPSAANNQVEFSDEDVVESSLAEDPPEDIQLENENTPAEVQVDTLLTTCKDYQLETVNPITPPPAACLNDFSLEDWLQRRIGEGQTIWSTGDVDQVNQEKYYSHKVGTKLDIKGYIEGKPRCIYGSPLRLKDGKTWVLSFDIDKTEQALLKFDYLLMLARAGIYAVYWIRRPGRAHLEMYFSEEVDINAAYAWVISVCPQLGEIEECYPYSGKFNGRVSWPLYHRLKTFDEDKQEISDQVIECAAIAMLPGADKPIHCPGIKSDPEGLRAIVAQAVTAAALIPDRIVTQETDEATGPGGSLVDLPRSKFPSCTGDGLGKVVIAEFSDRHTWKDITGVESGYFLASWRGERTASVLINDDGETAHDFGNSGAFPNHFDKFDVYCLINGLDKKEELKRRIAERRVSA